LVQQVTGSPGNLSLLLTARKAPPFGLTIGLRSLAQAASLRPIWTIHASNLLTLFSIAEKSAIVGVMALLLMTTIAVVAWRTGRLDLAALATIQAVCSLSLVITISVVGRNLVSSLTYLVYVVWLVGILLWVTAGWGVVEVVRSRVTLRVPYAVAISGLVLAALLAVPSLVDSAQSQVSRDDVLATRMAQAVETRTPRGPVAVSFDIAPDDAGPRFDAGITPGFGLGTGMGYQLTLNGWIPALPPVFSAYTGIVYPRNSASPAVTVFVDGGHATVLKTRRS
jgi:hypothetical protein